MRDTILKLCRLCRYDIVIDQCPVVPAPLLSGNCFETWTLPSPLFFHWSSSSYIFFPYSFLLHLTRQFVMYKQLRKGLNSFQNFVRFHIYYITMFNTNHKVFIISLFLKIWKFSLDLKNLLINFKSFHSPFFQYHWKESRKHITH